MTEKKKIYYYLGVYITCGICGYTCNYDTDIFFDTVDYKNPPIKAFYCTNEQCSQYNIRGILAPLEAETMENPYVNENSGNPPFCG